MIVWLLKRGGGHKMSKPISTVLVGTVAMSLAVGGCGKSASGGAAADSQSIRQLIKADETKWNAQFKSKDSEGLDGHYADDAYFVAPGVTADGSTEIRKVYADASTDQAFEVQFASDKIDVAGSGDLAYARGKFSEQYTDRKSGKVMSGKGSFITVYKKQPDGSWKVVEDFAAADPDSIKPVPPAKPATRAKMVSF
jgi:uncharacterized protein (TIGR02246 family)